MRQLFQEAVDSAPCIVFIGEPGLPLSHPFVCTLRRTECD